MKTSSVSLYIHWPYCLSKCPYCDFASRVCSAPDEEALWHGYERDLKQWLDGRPVSTIFFGGGTPSLMGIPLVERILNYVAQKVEILPNCEITMEANPDAITAEKMKALKGLGINRLSLGVQALDEETLRFLGRRHTVQTALQRIEEALGIFQRVNADLIYARPGQTPDMWQTELKHAIGLGLKHYSLYQLTVEERTVFGRTGVQPADEETAVVLYRLTDEIMAAAGCPAYEVSNYAAPGEECRHNLAYWTGADYVGIGPAAHGRLGLTATANPPTVAAWLKNGACVERLTSAQKQTERLLMGLRLRQAWFPVTGLNSVVIRQLTEKGLLVRSDAGIRPTLAGTLLLDRVVMALMPT